MGLRCGEPRRAGAMRAPAPACGLGGAAWEMAGVRCAGGKGCEPGSLNELSFVVRDRRELSRARIGILKDYVFRSGWDAKADSVGCVMLICTSDTCLGELLPALDAVPMHRRARVTYSWVRQEGCQHSRLAGLSGARAELPLGL